MPSLRPVPIEREPFEFKPVPGQEDEWASFVGVERSSLWDWLGTYPLIGFIIFLLLCMGVANV